MGFLQTIKNKLGIGGVKVELQVPGQVAKTASIISGKVILTTKSEQEVTGIAISLKEEYTTGRGNDKKTKEFTLGELKFPVSFTLKPGDTKEIPFDLNFSLIKSNNDDLRERGGAMGALGSMAAFANAEKSEYSVEAHVDVKSAALDPMDKKDIKLV
jgi:hypothetical protein